MHVRYQLASPFARPPTYATPGAAGADLHAVSYTTPLDQRRPWWKRLLGLDAPRTDASSYVLRPGERVKVQTGVRLEIPPGAEGQVRSRSGWAFNGGVFAFHGTVDSDFRGPVVVLLVNMGTRPVTLHRGDRVAQVVFAPARQATLEDGELGSTVRGAGGLGSTGR